VHPDDVARARVETDAAFKARARFSLEMRLRCADGEYRWVLSEGMPRNAQNGEFLGYAGSLLDITERRVAEQELKDTNAVLAEELEEKTQREAEIRGLSARLIHAQEEERRRLSRELHDDLSQQIAALSIGMGNLKRGIPPEQTKPRGQSDRIQQKLIELSEAVRRMSHELHPAILHHSGLVPALRGYCREFGEVSGIRVTLRTVGEFADARPEVALSVFRIVQEALRNVAKHARVNEAAVELIHTGEAIRLTVSDAGVGFAANSGRTAGLGMVSIRERTRLVQGTVEIESAPGVGTRLTIRIPDGNPQLPPAEASG
jgi:signal transduction histidine kinase